MNNRFEETRKEILELLGEVHGPKLYYIRSFIRGLIKRK